MSRPTTASIVCCALVTAIASAHADDRGMAADGPRVRVAASDRYQANRLHRFTFGGGYRDLWETEIELPVLDLEREGGGLVPTGRFGGLQTAVLGFRAPDGRSYTFRGTDKDPSVMLDPDLHGTVVETLVQDQMAAQHPAGPVATSVLAEAAGLLTIRERMVVMPDDPRLGEFRDEFAGMVGAFYEFPTPSADTHPGFHGAVEIIDHEDLYARLERGGEAVDVEAFLRARLFDILIGDFDRHRKQWRWAMLPGDERWKPIPEDRDMAFVRYEGLGTRAAAVYFPILQKYSADYPSMRGLTLHGWEQDRWLLAALSWAQWEPIARDLQSRITDEVIDAAIRSLPPEYAALDGERLRADLRGRRDGLPEAARSYYEHLAREVDVRASDAAEEVVVSRDEGGATLVEITRLDSTGSAGVPVYSRRFVPDETRHVRIYLRDGDDRVRVTGSPGCIRLRVIAGGGRKTLDDSQGGGTRVYDESGSVEVARGPRTRVIRKHYEPPESDSGFVDVDDVPARDWGSEIIPVPVFGYESDVGAFLGAGVIYTRHGFRKHPWSSRFLLTAGGATEAGEPRIHFNAAFRPESSRFVGDVDFLFSGIEVLRWYGFGNDTSDSGSDSFYRVRNRVYRVMPSVRASLDDDRYRLQGAVRFERSQTKDGNRFIDQNDPYGAGDFMWLGLSANAQFDTRRTRDEYLSDFDLGLHENPAAGYPTSGFLLDVTAEVSPPAWDVDRTWGAIEGTAAAFLTGGEQSGWLERMTLAVRAGGRATFGKTPYFQAAFIGGVEFFSGRASVRGFRDQRFAGDYSVFGNTELRIFLVRGKLIVPGDIGVIAFTDVGRVFLDGESSKKWHVGYGGGVWFAPLSRANAISLSVADSREETLVYMRIGFHY
jgi:hypothetical protein